MTAENESIMLDILVRIQADIAEMKQDVRDLKVRVGLLEGHVSHLLAVQRHTNERLDRLNDRVERIERCFDLVDAR